jgi:hypothetical protein
MEVEPVVALTDDGGAYWTVPGNSAT